MATGAAHYQQAERLTVLAGRQFEDADPDEPSPQWMLTIQQAQVHATLAAAAAHIEDTLIAFARGEGDDERVITEWAEAVSG